MRSARLDQTDWRILRELQADGRITNVELARKVGISAPLPAPRPRAGGGRVDRGYAALLDDRALGYDVTAFAMVGLHSQAEADLIAFEERVRGSPIVRNCYAFGRDRLHAEMRGAGPHCVSGFIIHELTAAPNAPASKPLSSSARRSTIPACPSRSCRRTGERRGLGNARDRNLPPEQCR